MRQKGYAVPWVSIGLGTCGQSIVAASSAWAQSVIHDGCREGMGRYPAEARSERRVREGWWWAAQRQPRLASQTIDWLRLGLGNATIAEDVANVCLVHSTLGLHDQGTGMQ